MEIIWEDEASEQLKKIIDFYLQVAGPRTTEKILDKIENTANRLALFPCMGPLESELADLSYTYRSIVTHPHYKIIYRVTEKVIYIVGIWDCRPDPERLKSLITKKKE